jgi:hypothetical protein
MCLFRHLEHAFLMDAELDRLKGADPSRYEAVARVVKPLIVV